MKKGHYAAYLVGLLLMAAIIIVAFLLIKGFSNATDSSLKNMECKNSVTQHIKYREFYELRDQDINTAPPIECPVAEDTLTSKDETVLKKQIADRMKKCWDDFYQGQEELFLTEAVYCQPCHIISFENNVEINDFGKYLLTNKPKGELVSYADYFATNTNNKAAQDNFQDIELSAVPQHKIYTNKDYVTLFYYNKDAQYIKEFFEEAESLAGGAVVGATAGAIAMGTLSGTVCGIFTFGTAAISCGVAGAKLGAVVGGIAGAWIGSEIVAADYPLWISSVSFREYNPEELEELGCQIAPATQGNFI